VKEISGIYGSTKGGADSEETVRGLPL